MPLYEFQCTKCSEVITKLIRHDTVMPVCVSDGCDGVWEKILSRAGLVFEKKFYPNGKDWNETRREKWEKPRSWQER